MGGKVLVPTQEFITKLISARLAADICGVPTVLIARTDAEAAKLITSDIDDRDRPFLVGGDRTSEGFYYIKNGVDTAIARGLAYAPYADLVWCETSRPNIRRPQNSPKQLNPAIRINCWPITAPHLSTGNST